MRDFTKLKGVGLQNMMHDPIVIPIYLAAATGLTFLAYAAVKALFGPDVALSRDPDRWAISNERFRCYKGRQAVYRHWVSDEFAANPKNFKVPAPVYWRRKPEDAQGDAAEE